MIHLMEVGMGRVTLVQQSLHHILLDPNHVILGNGTFGGGQLGLHEVMGTLMRGLGFQKKIHLRTFSFCPHHLSMKIMDGVRSGTEPVSHVVLCSRQHYEGQVSFV